MIERPRNPHVVAERLASIKMVLEVVIAEYTVIAVREVTTDGQEEREWEAKREAEKLASVCAEFLAKIDHPR